MDYISKTTRYGNHTVPDIRRIKLADHLYVYMKGYKALFRHHGIVVHIPKNAKDLSEEELYDQILLLEITKNKTKTKVQDNTKHEIETDRKTEIVTGVLDIRETTLYDFCYQKTRTLKYVVYDVNPVYETFSLAGTCHTHKPLPAEQTLQKCAILYKELRNELTYSLFTCNCEDLALWCKTAFVAASFSPQVRSVLYKIGKIGVKHGAKALERWLSPLIAPIFNSTTSHVVSNSSTSLISTTTSTVGTNSSSTVVSTVTKEMALQATSKTVTTTGNTVLSKGTANVARAAALTSGQIAQMTMFGGVTMGIEAGVCLGRVIKYKNDIQYTSSDLAYDCNKGISTSLIITGTGIGCIALGIGWWAVIPCLVVGVLAHLGWQVYKKYGARSWKEKMYIQFGDKGDFTNKFGIKIKEDFKNIKKLRKLQSKLRKYIRKYKLHPDTWTDLDREEMNNIKQDYKNNVWIKRWWFKMCDATKNGLKNTFKSQEDLISSYKTKKDKLKLFFLFTAIMAEIDKDITEINQGKDPTERDQQPEKETIKAIEL